MILKKYGRQRQHTHGYENFPLSKGEIMWWEVEGHNGKSKKTERKQAVDDIEAEINLIK